MGRGSGSSSGKPASRPPLNDSHSRRQIADRLGTTYDGCSAAYLRAGDLTPDRRTA